jgi:ferritin-like metal-binding protein YciE
MTALGSIEDVYAGHLGALRSIETQLLEVLPQMVAEADDPKLSRAFSEHLERVERQAARLDEIIGSSPVEVAETTSKAMQGLVAEVHQVLEADAPGEVRDVALVAVAQRIAHHEIASYGTARALADQLDLRLAVELLGETLGEESQVDELLSKLATGGLIVSGLNERAQE